MLVSGRGVIQKPIEPLLVHLNPKDSLLCCSSSQLSPLQICHHTSNPTWAAQHRSQRRDQKMPKNPCSMIKRETLSLPILYHVPPHPQPVLPAFQQGPGTLQQQTLLTSLHSCWVAFAGWWLYSPLADMTLLQKLISSHPMENQNIYLPL